MAKNRNQAVDRSDRSTPRTRETNVENAGEPDGVDLLGTVSSIEARNETFMGQLQKNSWSQSLRAYNNQHPTKSKYNTDPYRDRSKNFRPKTRSAVRKNMATTAAALFSSSDVVTIEAEYDDDPVKRASAAVLQQALNYRLDRSAWRSGVPWFLIVMGAVQNANIHGICCSKQTWEYVEITEEVEEEYEEPVYTQALDEAGSPILDEAGNEYFYEDIEIKTRTVKKTHILRDRPISDLFAPENVIVDPATSWIDPANSSPYLVLRYPMTEDDVRTMLKNPGKAGEEWLEVTDDQLTMAREDYTARGVRVARNRGIDRYDNRTGTDKTKSNVVWVYENFIRINGVDRHFWSLGSNAYLSKVRTTRQAYPEQFGMRPVVIGYGAIEAHNPFPMSPVESWQPMQREANDLVNLRLDTMKQALSPIAKVRAGTVFDWKQLQRRGGQNATIIVNSMEDLEFDRSPDATASSYQEMSYLNADFDDLAGAFSGSSVQTNRQLNETVGGMRLLSGSANATSEFDLRVFVETWVEATLRQIVRCIQFYESDETVLAIAGSRAKLERFGVDALTDRDLETEVSVKVNAGVGAADPMQGLQKLGMALQMLGNVAPFLDKQAKVNAEEIIKEVMGKAGYNDGMRFFVLSEGGETPPPELMIEQLRAQIEERRMQLDAQMNEADNQTKRDIAKQQSILSLIETVLSEKAQTDREAMQMQYDQAASAVSGFVDIFNQRAQHGLEREGMERKERSEREARGSQERMGMAGLLTKAAGDRANLSSKERLAREGLQAKERMGRETLASRERSEQQRARQHAKTVA